MEISFELTGKDLILTYSGRAVEHYREKLNEDGWVTILKLFTFKKEDWIPIEDIDSLSLEDLMELNFKLGEVINDEYILIKAGKITYYKDVIFYDYPEKFKEKWFRVPGLKRFYGSVFRLIENQLFRDKNAIVIGNSESCYLTWDDFKSIISKIPNDYEINLYVQSRVSNTLKQFTFVENDFEDKLNNYRKRYELSEPIRDYPDLYDFEIEKYRFLLEEIKLMLSPEKINSFSEEVWQKQIAKIFLLLFPKYLCLLEKVKIKDSYKFDGENIGIEGSRYPDFMLLSNNGNVDILEIKRPTSKSSILRKGQYRDNYIPSRELTGTIMQAEKYILNLIKWGIEGEKKLNSDYNDRLPEGLKLHINSPKAILILGYEENLDIAQLRDLEIIKRKYANVVDIITYDDLMHRLENTIAALEFKKNN